MSTIDQVTFVIPAYNAGRTLRDALQSICRQTFDNWRAIVVDDGSLDGTGDVAREFAAIDPRIRVLSQANAGAAAARNRGVEAAETPFVAFLDADDWIEPDFAATLMPVVLAGDGPTVAYCRVKRVRPDGSQMSIEELPDLRGDRAYAVVTERCPIAIHSAVIPRRLYLDVGGMPVIRPVCEDWEMWTRIAFAGAAFVPVDRCLGAWRHSEGSLTDDPRLLLKHAIEVIDLGDRLFSERFGSGVGVSATRRLPADLAKLKTAVWAAGTAIRQAPDPADLFALLTEIPDVLGFEDDLAAAYLHGLSVGLEVGSYLELLQRREEWYGSADGLFRLLDQVSRTGAWRTLWTATARRFAEHTPDGGIFLGPVWATAVDIGQRARMPATAAEDAVIALMKGRRCLGVVDMPAGPSTFHELLSRVGPSWTFRRTARVIGVYGLPAFVLGVARSLRGTIGPALRLRHPGDRRVRMHAMVDRLRIAGLAEVGRAADLRIATRSHEPDADGLAVSSTRAEDGVDYWESVFAEPDPWKYTSDYETTKYRQTLEFVPANVGTAVEIACAEGIFTKLLAAQVDHVIALDISRIALERAAERCAGLENVTFRQFDLVSGILPAKSDLIICSEVLYFLKDKGALRDFARKVASSLKPNGSFVTAHAHLIADEPERTGFDWDNPFGVGTIRNVFADVESLTLEEALETELYAILRFRKHSEPVAPTPPALRRGEHGPLEPEVEQCVVWGGAIMRRSDALRSEATAAVPVLMYHRIAEDGPPALSRWRVTPAAFKEQIRLLRRLGYHTIDSEALGDVLARGKVFAGRPILITFDDGYQDFADFAAPVLERAGYGAEIFLVTDKVGETSDWDCRYGPPAPLMDWSTVQALEKQGFRFSSHLASHTPATYLTTPELAAEAVRSRKVLKSKIDRDTTTVALPFGAYDGRVMPVLARCGYRMAFSTDSGVVTPSVPRLRLPRIEVSGDMTLDLFAAALGQGEACASSGSPEPPREMAT